ncbi:MAG TPA: hypothetical protein VIO11_06415 [Candidatus Methanoperedens sp.]
MKKTRLTKEEKSERNAQQRREKDERISRKLREKKARDKKKTENAKKIVTIHDTIILKNENDYKKLD